MKKYDSAQIRRFLGLYHGLHSSRQAEGIEGVSAIFDRLGSIQFDPVDAAGKNHDLVLNARIQDYTPDMLFTHLYDKRTLIEGWDKMASIFPVDTWPKFHTERAEILSAKNRRYRQLENLIPQVIEEIEKRGPLSSLDLENYGKLDWYWAEANKSRAALDLLFESGTTVIHHRSGMRKYYDLADKILPSRTLPGTSPFRSHEEYLNWRYLRRIGSVGAARNAAGDTWLGIPDKRERNSILRELKDTGEISPIITDTGIELLVKSSELPLLEEAETFGEDRSNLRFIAPLDNLVWDRILLQKLYGFTYRWEIYKPAIQRIYGYYVLPVYFNDLFVARFEPFRDKREKSVHLKNWWWETADFMTPQLKEEVVSLIPEAMKNFTRFLGLDTYECKMEIFS